MYRYTQVYTGNRYNYCIYTQYTYTGRYVSSQRVSHRTIRRDFFVRQNNYDIKNTIMTARVVTIEFHRMRLRMTLQLRYKPTGSSELLMVLIIRKILIFAGSLIPIRVAEAFGDFCISVILFIFGMYLAAYT